MIDDEFLRSLIDHDVRITVPTMNLHDQERIIMKQGTVRDVQYGLLIFSDGNGWNLREDHTVKILK